jgi:hypothetical protein
LEDIILFKLLEDGRFDLDELIRQQKSQKGVGIGVHSDVQGDDLVKQGYGMDYVVNEGQYEHPQRPEYLASAVEITLQCLVRKQTFINILSEGGEESIGDLERFSRKGLEQLYS